MNMQKMRSKQCGSHGRFLSVIMTSVSLTGYIKKTYYIIKYYYIIILLPLLSVHSSWTFIDLMRKLLYLLNALSFIFTYGPINWGFTLIGEYMHKCRRYTLWFQILLFQNAEGDSVHVHFLRLIGMYGILYIFHAITALHYENEKDKKIFITGNIVVCIPSHINLF